MADPSSAIEGLGAFPIIQIAVAAVIAVSALMAILRGAKKSKPDDRERAVSMMYFDGPLVRALDRLDGIYRLSGEMRDDWKNTVVEFRGRHDDELALLREISETMRRMAEDLRRALDRK